MSGILLRAEHLSKDFPAPGKKKVHAVSDVSLTLYRGETLGLVGESGCGKSTLGRLLLRLLKADSGEIWFGEEKISDLSEKDFQGMRRKMQLIFQDPYASLDPRMRVRDLIGEPLRTYHLTRGRKELTGKVLGLMQDVEVPGEFLLRYPHQFSGGQRQRIGIARALAASPELLVCDEPVSALDVSVQNQILNLLKTLQKDRGLTYLFISHDLSVVRNISNRVCIMFLGKICEMGQTDEVYEKPLHPYTRFLLDAVPKLDPAKRKEPVRLLKGDVPSPMNVPSGCRFHTRCPYAKEICREKEPALTGSDGRLTACHFPGIGSE